MTADPVERGAALPLALFVLVVLGVLVGSTLWAAHMESRAGRHTLEALKARLAGDQEWPDIVSRSDSLSLSALAPGDSLVLGLSSGLGGVSVQMVLHRLGSGFFLVESVGMAGHPGARYGVQVLTRLDSTLDSLSGHQARRLTPLVPPFWSGIPRAR